MAVGKSTTGRILQALLSRWPDHPKVELVTTDGLLYSNEVLSTNGLLHRKGFPESYDRRRLVRFLSEVKSGAPSVDAPVYSHLLYDVVPGVGTPIESPDILILEGLNVLQSGGTWAFIEVLQVAALTTDVPQCGPAARVHTDSGSRSHDDRLSGFSRRAEGCPRATGRQYRRRLEGR